MKTKYHKVGANIKKLRQEYGMTQEEFGKKCSLTATAISHFECGRRLPSFSNLIDMLKICKNNEDILKVIRI